MATLQQTEITRMAPYLPSSTACAAPAGTQFVFVRWGPVRGGPTRTCPAGEPGGGPGQLPRLPLGRGRLGVRPGVQRGSGGVRRGGQQHQPPRQPATGTGAGKNVTWLNQPAKHNG